MKQINFKRVVRDGLLAFSLLLPLGCGGTKTIYRAEPPTESQSVGYNNIVPILEDTSKTVQPLYGQPIQSIYYPDSGYFTVCFEVPEGLLRVPLSTVSKIVDMGNIIEIYDTAGLVFRVTGLPGDTVFVEERITKATTVDGRRINSKEIGETWKGSGSFDLQKVNESLFKVSIQSQAQYVEPYLKNYLEGYHIPPSPFVVYSTSGSPYNVIPRDNAGVALWFNIKNPNDWYFRENSLIKTLRRVNGGSLDLADLKEFFIGPYFNSILAMRALGYVPNVSADLNLAVAALLYSPWRLYANLGLKGETHVIGTNFFSRGTPYAGIAKQFPWHLFGSEINGTNELGVRLNYKFEKGYTLNWADTTTRVFENKGWSIDVAYLFSIYDNVAVCLGVNDAVYSIHGVEVTYNSSLEEIESENDIYIRPHKIVVVGLGMGGMYSPIVASLDAKFSLVNYYPLSLPFSEIGGGLAFSFTPYNVPFTMTIHGEYPWDGRDKRISLSMVLGNSEVGMGGSVGGNVNNGDLTSHMYSGGLCGRNNRWPY